MATQKNIFGSYPTYENFLSVLHPNKMLVAFADITSIEQSISKKRISLEDVDVYYQRPGFSPAVDYLEKWLEFLNQFSNINKPLIEKKAVAFMIYSKRKHFFLTDLKILFCEIMDGRHGTFFGSVDAQRILYAFAQYDIARMQTATKYLQKINDKFDSIKGEIERREKDRIFAEVEKTTEKGAKRWEIYQKRCNEEIPPIIQKEYEVFINSQTPENG